MDIDDALLSWFMSFSPTGQFIAVGIDMTDVKKWDACTGDAPEMDQVLSGVWRSRWMGGG